MAIASPCIKQCCLDQLDICIGCGRTLDEITGWAASDDVVKEHIIQVAKQRCDNRAAYHAQSLVKRR